MAFLPYALPRTAKSAGMDLNFDVYAVGANMLLTDFTNEAASESFEEIGRSCQNYSENLPARVNGFTALPLGRLRSPLGARASLGTRASRPHKT